MFYFASADFDVEHRDVAAQKVLLRKRTEPSPVHARELISRLETEPPA